jgi:hypothetical protein
MVMEFVESFHNLYVCVHFWFGMSQRLHSAWPAHISCRIESLSKRMKNRMTTKTYLTIVASVGIILRILSLGSAVVVQQRQV